MRVEGAAPEGQPYVGLRPFDRSEKHLFFGRDRHAQIVVDKILSTRLTVLYAQSGHGKSSLLRALVIPELEEEDAVVLYFDEWTQEDPVAGLKAELLSLAARLGVEDAGDEGSSIAELVRRISGAEERTIVLVLDQFEEYLIAHGRHLDAVRRELAELCRARGLDAHILLSLREEFLAALEPFRQEILDLFRSTYRLEELSDKGLRAAIQQPMQVIGGSCENSLVERLIADLRAKEVAERADAVVASSVELPMLQLVCSRLWESAERKRTRDLTLALYQELGGAEKILREYVRDVVPARRKDQLVTARMMQLLAPRSGLKMSFAPADLAENTGVAEGAVRSELDRLEKARILRVRRYKTGNRYELQHDAFIKVVEPWRDAVLARSRRRRLLGATLAGTAVAAAILVGVLLYAQAQERQRLKDDKTQAEKEILAEKSRAAFAEAKQLGAEKKIAEARAAANESEQRWQAGGALADLWNLPESERALMATWRFDSVAAYWVYRQEGESRWEALTTLLRDNEELLPPRYGLSPVQTTTPEDTESPLVLEYSSRRKLDAAYFQAHWRHFAQSFAANWGLVAMPRLRLVPNDTFPPELLRVSASGVSTEFDADNDDTRPVLLAPDLSPVGQELFRFMESELEEVAGLKWWGKSWSVPHWSLPAWKVTNCPVTHGSGVTALMVANHLLSDPGPLLCEPAVQALLERVRGSSGRVTVSEAQRARGASLREDLADLVVSGVSLTNLRYLLDALADFDEERDAAVYSALLFAGSPSMQFAPPKRFRGPWKSSTAVDGSEAGTDKSSTAVDGSEAGTDQAPYQQVAARMPPLPSWARVYASGRFEEELYYPDRLAPGLAEGVERVLDDLMRRFGVIGPTPGYYRSGWQESPDGDACRILHLNQLASSSDAFTAPPGEALQAFEREYGQRCADVRAFWISPEDAANLLGRIAQPRQQWILRTYSISDVKCMLRGVVSPPGRTAAPAPEHTIRHGMWLLESLLFWGLVEEPLDAHAIIERLIATQRARLEGPADVSEDPAEVVEAVRLGTQALDDDVEEAQAAWGKALAQDREAAVRAFLTSWVERFHQKLGERFDALVEANADADDPVLSRSDRIDLEEYLDASGRDAGTGGGERRAGLLATLVQGSSAAPRSARIDQFLRFLPEGDALRSWPASKAAALGLAAAKLYDPIRDPPRLLERATEVLVSAFARLEHGEASLVFSEIAQMSQDRDAKAWIAQLLRRLATTPLATSAHNLELDLAWFLAGQMEPDGWEEALRLLEGAEERVEMTTIQPVQREYLGFVTAIIRASVKLNLGIYEGSARIQEARDTLLELLEREPAGFEDKSEPLQQIYRGAMGLNATGAGQALRVEGRLDEAETYFRRAMSLAPTEASAYLELALLHFVRGSDEAAAEVASRALEMAGSDDPAAFFTAALLQILTGSGRWELTAREFLLGEHEYRDYIAMLLYAYLADEGDRRGAKDVLERRWAVIARERHLWPARLGAGDLSAWREMLIGYYLGEVPREEVFGPLEDAERFAASPLAHLPAPRQGLRSEAFFYDAILAKAKGDRDLMQKRLQQCVDVGYRLYLEHYIAERLLTEE